ncbi:hypothetical protein N9Q05_02285 [bacterium]|nr:hypothetical protein [bacterium]
MQNTKSNENTSKEQQSGSSCDCPGNTWVYIWKMTAQKVGHAAIQVGGCTAKRDEHDNHGEYISIHPNMIPSIGPTVILPLPAGLANTLTHDMAAEAAALHQNSLEDLTGIAAPLPTSLPPDYTFYIPNLKTDAMRELITITRAEVTTGQTAYQLLPEINTLAFFKEAPQYLNYNPVDIAKPSHQPHQSSSYGDKKYNCVTLVSTILVAGGMPLQPSKMPWGETPNSLGKQLSSIK